MPGVPGKLRLLDSTVMLITQASLGSDTTNGDFSLPVKGALHQADLLGPIGKLNGSEPALASAAPSSMQSFVKGRGAQLASIRQMSRSCPAAPLASIRQMSRQVSRGSVGEIRQMSRQVSRGSAGEYQADERAGVARLSWRVSGR